ncbi:M24 family metallopeptidase [Candidatus Woesearchaeota archaeon]|nr:M24 family metallopeptidase [Candidatus Woesearchaeota archaeon]
MKECFDNFNFGTEIEIAEYLRKKAKEKNCKLAFPPLIVSGNNFLEIHHKSNETRLDKFIIVDFGVKYDNYCSDVTRMLYKGKPSRKDLELYQLILNLHETALREIKIGMNCFELDAMIRDGYGNDRKKFRHSLGHGVGKRIHQPPWISAKSKYNFKDNDVVTIEPGWYSKNKGVRIEDTVLLKGNKVEVLTNLSKELIVLD